MKRILLYGLLLLISLAAVAQDVVVDADYPSVVTVGQQFTVSWSVNAGGGDFATPPFTGFSKLLGPQTSYSSNTQIINGKVSQQTTYTYTYYLQTIKEGKYVIPPATFTLKNKTYSSDSMRIEVIADNTSNQGNQAGNSKSGSEQSSTQTAGGDLFVDVIADRKEVFQGEHILVTVKVYTRVNLSGFNEIKYPSFDNYLKTDLETEPPRSLKQETLNGKTYGTAVLQQFLLYPQVTGEITIDPVQVSVLVQQKSTQSDPFFGDFFSSYTNVEKIIISKAKKINVKPLPGVRPSDFSGVIGKLNIKAAVNKDTVDVNDAVNYKITIAGEGNLKLASAPDLKLSPDIEIYDPKSNDNIKNGVGGSSGQKTFEYLLIPRHYGDFTIPAVTYSYFNTSNGRFEQLTTPEFHFYARKGNEQNSTLTVYGGVSKEDVKYVGKDIRFIKPSAGIYLKPAGVLLKKRSFLSLYAFSLFIFIVVLIVRREHIKRNSDITAVRNRKAGKVAVKRLHVASECLKSGHTDRFYEEILKALWGYLGDKLGIQVSELTRTNTVIALEQKGISDEQIKNLSDILDTCEYARYAPSKSDTAAVSIYENASKFISSIENTIG